MGAIFISAGGSMNPAATESEKSTGGRTVTCAPSGSFQRCVDDARRELDRIEQDLRARLGDEEYERTEPKAAEPPPSPDGS